MIKLLLLGLFLYFIIRFVLRFVLPVAKMTISINGTIKSAMKEMNKHNQPNTPAQPKATMAKPGDYIDYEMVK
ncbi:MAG: hypothetical protein JST36_03630 [Bacteroidetes bacterium]|nr:hypothetical protein [Bacteroidota bacterium]